MKPAARAMAATAAHESAADAENVDVHRRRASAVARDEQREQHQLPRRASAASPARRSRVLDHSSAALTMWLLAAISQVNQQQPRAGDRHVPGRILAEAPHQPHDGDPSAAPAPPGSRTPRWPSAGCAPAAARCAAAATYQSRVNTVPTSSGATQRTSPSAAAALQQCQQHQAHEQVHAQVAGDREQQQQPEAGRSCGPRRSSAIWANRPMSSFMSFDTGCRPRIMGTPDCTDHPAVPVCSTVSHHRARARALRRRGSRRSHASGLDTEFLRERTYRAQLCLLQIASPTEALCVDPLALPDLAPLDACFRGQRAQGDARLAPGPGGAAAGGRADPSGIRHADRGGADRSAGAGRLRGAVRRLLGTELAKSHTRTDWSRRPLSAAQLEYALDDVRYLLPLAHELESQLERLGRLDWLREELRALDGRRPLTLDPDEAWRGSRDCANWTRRASAWRARSPHGASAARSSITGRAAGSSTIRCCATW